MSVDVQLLAEIPLFQSLEPDDFAVLAREIQYRDLEAGETLFRAGDPGDSLFIVCVGAVELSMRDTVGQKIFLKTAAPGEVFGELSLLDEGPRTATAVADCPTRLLMLDRDTLLFLFKKKPEAALHMLAAMGAMTRRADELLRSRSAKNVNDEHSQQLTMVERAADWIAWFSGSMYFLALNALGFFAWIGINIWGEGTVVFDPFPFGLLTMIVSLEAIFLSIFVLISQNRQASKDRVRADIEYDINVKAELEVAHLHEKVDHLHAQTLSRITQLERLLVNKKKLSIDDAATSPVSVD